MLSYSPTVRVAATDETRTEQRRENGEQSEADEEENLKEKILSAGLAHVGRHGWTRLALAAGAESVGYISVVSGLFSRDEELVFYHIKESNIRLDRWMEQEVEGYKVEQTLNCKKI